MMLGTIGRPPIGPKVQTNVPDEHDRRIKREAKERGVKHAVVVRELILEALAARERAE